MLEYCLEVAVKSGGQKASEKGLEGSTAVYFWYIDWQSVS